MTNPKIIALYLPQFHQIPENDEFWGEGFTDWVTVKNSKPLFEGHNQPRIPLNDNYYDLSIKDNIVWQSKLAHDHGIYGFGVYHYWFNNDKNLLTKPAEIMRDALNLETKYFYVWDNCLWKRSWSNVDGNAWTPIGDENQKKDSSSAVLIPYILGNEKDWENHYNYLRSHFISKNYEKIDNKPVFSIINYDREIAKMCDYWDMLAQKDGFNGIFFIYRDGSLPVDANRYNYEPHRSWKTVSLLRRVINKSCRCLGINYRKEIEIFDYDLIWKKLLKNASNHSESNYYHCAFVGYDDSPRRGKMNSVIINGANPNKFEKYFGSLYSLCRKQNKEYLFFTAWNEWGEGAYLEPDISNGLDFLVRIKKIVNNSSI